MIRSLVAFFALNFVVALPPAKAQTPVVAFDDLSDRFTSETLPIVKRHCLGCHSTEKMEGDLDLERFAGLADVRKEPELWRHAMEQILEGEMPPKNRKRPTEAEKSAVIGWIREYLHAEALANAGDPGPVLLRRLTNTEFDNTIRDLTGFDLKPTREFPADGAAGEGFTNVGEALVMSPALLEKYLEAAKSVASHLVLLPDGLKFSASSTPADWTNEYLDAIRKFYHSRTDPVGHTRVKLQGLEWETNAGGRIPVTIFLQALIELRAGGKTDAEAIRAAALAKNLSPKYLAILQKYFTESTTDPIALRLQRQFAETRLDTVQELASEIQRWQMALTSFGSVGHFKPWLGTVDPIVRNVRVSEKIEPNGDGSPVVVTLAASAFGDVDAASSIAWSPPRLERPGKAPIPLTRLSEAVAKAERVRKELRRSSSYLRIVDEARDQQSQKPIDWADKAQKAGLDAELLASWAVLAGIGTEPIDLTTLMRDRIEKSGDYDFVKGWGRPETPIVVANSSEQNVQVPGLLKARSVAVHPSPTKSVAVSWRSPIAGSVRVRAVANDVHGDCGNGVTWSLEARRGGSRRVLAAGTADASRPNVIAPVEALSVSPGTVVSLVIGPRDREHSCDLTETDLTIEESDGQKRVWSLSADISPNINAGNPHADAFGNAGVWSFHLEDTASGADSPGVVPAGSAIAQWLDAADPKSREEAAGRIDALFATESEAIASKADRDARSLLRSVDGPLLGRIDLGAKKGEGAERTLTRRIDAPLRFEIPAEWAKGATVVAEAAPSGAWKETAAIQISVRRGEAVLVSKFDEKQPLIVASDQAQTAWKSAFASFRGVFPAALCYPQIVPVDEVVTLALFHREDDNLIRLMLDDQEKAELDSFWNALRFISLEPLKVEVGYKQFMEYVTQDGDVRVFEPLRKPIRDRAEGFRRELVAAETGHWASLLKLADRAWRRPLIESEKADLRTLYESLRKQGAPHDESIRLVFARVLLSPAFLYLMEPADSQAKTRPLNDHELASRLSYFLWSSMPDDELRRLADSGRLKDPAVLTSQVRRMIADPKVRALATEFACQWLGLKDFDRHDEKSERIFPEFAELRGPMYEEVVQYFTDLFRANRPAVAILDSDRTFVNESIADFYGIPGVKGEQWRAYSGTKAAGRGGLLGFAALTAKQAGASRTSPILRGNWLLETLLGEKLPKPPKNVPQLPESELDTDGLTMRQITEKHRADPSCAKCHDRIDPFGMALEAFDAIGRRRTADLGGRAIDTSVTTQDGDRFSDIHGLRDYLLAKKKKQFARQFHRKLLGYALGRSVIVSDDPLLDMLQNSVDDQSKGVVDAVEAIVLSPQFLNRRGLRDDPKAE